MSLTSHEVMLPSDTNLDQTHAHTGNVRFCLAKLVRAAVDEKHHRFQLVGRGGCWLPDVYTQAVLAAVRRVRRQDLILPTPPNDTCDKVLKHGAHTPHTHIAATQQRHTAKSAFVCLMNVRLLNVQQVSFEQV